MKIENGLGIRRMTSYSWTTLEHTSISSIDKRQEVINWAVIHMLLFSINILQQMEGPTQSQSTTSSLIRIKTDESINTRRTKFGQKRKPLVSLSLLVLSSSLHTTDLKVGSVDHQLCSSKALASLPKSVGPKLKSQRVWKSHATHSSHKYQTPLLDHQANEISHVSPQGFSLQWFEQVRD
jgi:hypothetical protein